MTAITFIDHPMSAACRALWQATLFLMADYRNQPGPALRVMLARRIARNVATLARQSPCFAPGSRQVFAQLAQRWAGLAGWR